MPTNYAGQLNQNGVLSTLYNMIIGQEVFSKNIKLEGTLVEKFRIDGTLFGDTKLFISSDIGTLYDFPDTSKTLLTKTSPVAPQVQAVVVDTFKQTAITIDGVKLKQAFMSADIYGAFIGVCLQWLRDTYKVLNVKLINSFVGTAVTDAAKATVTVTLPEVPTTSLIERQSYFNLTGELIGEAIANVSVDLEDAMRDYNEYAFLRSYDLSDFMIIWNKAWANRIRHISLPMIFHKDSVVATEMDKTILNSQYFGDILTIASTANGTTTRTLVDMVIAGKQYFPGDLLPATTAYAAYQAYVANANIIGKIVHKRAIPFMSALMVQTEFYNPKDLDRNHYLTWGYSNPVYLSEYPLITLVAAVED